MSLPTTDRTKLNNLSPNLVPQQIAVSSLRLAVFQEIYTVLDNIITDLNAAQATGAVTTAKLADGGVSTVKLADNAVTGAKLLDAAVIASKLADGSVTTQKVGDGAVVTIKLADGAVVSAKIADLNITSGKIADNAIVTVKLADGAVLSAKIADGAVTSVKIADGGVTGAKIADNTITTQKLVDSIITAAKILDGSVTNAKIAPGSVTGDKVANGAINSQHMDAALLASSASLSTQAEFDKRGVNVQKYGAKGDGIADDTAALQAAINAVSSSGGGYVVIPPDSHLIITATINLKSNVGIVGYGDSSVIETKTTSDGFIFLSLSGVTGVTIRDLKLDGKVSLKTITLTKESGGIIIQKGSAFNLVDNVTFTGFGLRQSDRNDPENLATSSQGNFIAITAIEQEEGGTGVGLHTYANTVRNCRILDPNGWAAFGIRVWSNWTWNKESASYSAFVRDNILENNYIEGISWNGIELAGPAVRWNTVKNNTVKNHYGFGGIEADKGASENLYQGNKVENLIQINTAQYAYRDQGTYSETSDFPERINKDNVWIGNIATGITQSGSFTAAGMIVIRSDNCQIIGFTTRNIAASSPTNDNVSGIYVNLKVTNLNIQGARIYNVNTGVYSSVDYDGLSITGVSFNVNRNAYRGQSGSSKKSLTFNSNKVVGGAAAVVLSDEDTVIINGNDIRDTSSTPIGGNNAVNVLISGNIIKTLTAAATAISLGNDTQVEFGNVLNNCLVTVAANKRVTSFGSLSTGSQGNGTRLLGKGTAAPTTGQYYLNDFIENTSKTEQGTAGSKYVLLGWQCVLPGTPGNWVERRASTGN